MKRRVLMFVLIFVTLGGSLAARAQQTDKVRRIGYLAIGPARSAEVFDGGFFSRALRERGWVNGKNFVIERKYFVTEQEVRPLAAALVKSGVEIIVVLSATLAGAVREETTTIPIVILAGGDLMTTGLVASLARPGGNVTGVQVLQTDLVGKRLSLLREIVPALRHATALGGTGVAPNPAGEVFRTRFEDALTLAGGKLGVAVQVRLLGTSGPRPLFTEMIAQRTQGILVMGGSGTFAHGKEIFELARKNRLPTMCDTRGYVVAGCLASYGFLVEEISGRAAELVGKILKGAKPADLPVEQPTKFEFLINSKTARAIGITIPQSVLAQADEVLE